MSKTEEIYQMVIEGDMQAISGAVEDAVKAGENPRDILNKGMIAAMDELGLKFTEGDIFVPEMMISANTMKQGVETLKPHLAEGDNEGAGTVVIATVAGDLHDIGKNLVAMMLESAGFEIVDLGVDASAEDFVNAVRENPSTNLVCCSALLTTTMPAMKDIVDAMQEAGFREKVKIMIGGAPITQKYCDEIGADAFTTDAAAAVQKAKELLGVA